MKPLNYFEHIIKMPNRDDKYDLRLMMIVCDQILWQALVIAGPRLSGRNNRTKSISHIRRIC